MSLFKKIGNILGKVARVALPFVPGGAAVLAAGESVRSAVRGVSAAAPALSDPYGGDARFYRQPAVSTLTRGIGQPMSLLPSIAGALPGVGRAVGTVARRYGGAIGGLATAGAILYDAAGNPVRPRRRRSKGITARELKAFTRVTGIMNKYCKTPAPTRRRSAPRGKSCR